MTCPPHRWLIDTPDGRHRLDGTCRNCGAVRTDFYAAHPDDGVPWTETSEKRQGRAKRTVTETMRRQLHNIAAPRSGGLLCEHVGCPTACANPEALARHMLDCKYRAVTA